MSNLKARIAEDFVGRFSRLTRLLRARGRRVDEAEDAVQEAYVRLLKYVREGNDVKTAEAFLTRTAYNVAVDHRRSSRTHLYERRPIEKLQLLDIGMDPEEAAASQEFLKQTQRLLDDVVGERARRVFFLSCYEGFTTSEIAKHVNLGTRTVEKDLNMALRALTAARVSKGER